MCIIGKKVVMAINFVSNFVFYVEIGEILFFRFIKGLIWEVACMVFICVLESGLICIYCSKNVEVWQGKLFLQLFIGMVYINIVVLFEMVFFMYDVVGIVQVILLYFWIVGEIVYCKSVDVYEVIGVKQIIYYFKVIDGLCLIS